MPAPRSLYVHIPFCGSKCFYCDFNSYVTGTAARQTYVDALVKEMAMLAQDVQARYGRVQLDTIFFGGGTPTLLSLEQWQDVARTIRCYFELSPDLEWTTEANPGSADRELLSGLREIGVNRISFGAQTFNDTLLQAIGRMHDASDVDKSVRAARAAGFERVSLDLMIGLPGQTASDVEDAVARVLHSGVSHVSAYGLKVEPGTTFAKWQAAGHLVLPEEDDEADMYEALRSTLISQGFHQYEISNFAREDEAARHNLTYWRNLPYLAAGAGAHGYVAGTRYENVRALDVYARLAESGSRPVAESTAVSPLEAMEDALMLGLRLSEGVKRDPFLRRYGAALDEVFGRAIRSLVDRGWLLDDGDRIAIDPAYYPVANEIFASFIGVAAR
ncbi:MAG: radical SAM family heme chaperone HemW [Firmicutes bacterium]|nr:radical SAM family heme chaperone HemW [Bacillota bacterium]